MINIEEYRRILINWYQENKRDLPWRHTKDPYKIWLSEIILQQTRVAQGMSYYHAFVESYPDISQLAEASQDEVLSLWKGLGYYSRARNLHTTARHIMSAYNGTFPKEYKEVLSLKGVGKYTAAAICSFAYRQNHAVVDGNVIRVISRLYGITDAVDASQTLRYIDNLAQTLIDPTQPDTYNQAIMEFGALQCVPSNPDCASCVLSDQCVAYNDQLVQEIPYKAKKIKRKSRYFHYLVISDEKQIVLNQRKQKDIWQGLYELPLIEKPDKGKIVKAHISEQMTLIGFDDYHIEGESQLLLQKLTHRDIHVKFYHLSVSDIQGVTNDTYFLVDQKKVSTFALPKVIDNYLSILF